MPSWSMPLGMAYIVQRKNRFYVVDYDGMPITGRERRRWRLAGHTRAEADEVAARVALDHVRPPRSPVSLGGFLLETWLPRKQVDVRATTAYRYAWMVDCYIVPRLGDVSLSALRPDHLDDLYAHLLTAGGRHGTGLSAKTVHEVHLVIRNALDLAVHRQLLDRNVASAVHSPKRRGGAKTVARVWDAGELATFLAAARAQRLYPALHLAAYTGTRRGEVAGLKWHDLDVRSRRVSVRRSLQCLAGTPVEFGAKTRSSRRPVDLDAATVRVLQRWRRRLEGDGLPHGPDDWMFCNTHGRFLNPESISQLFARVVERSGVPRIRFHDLRHTHASLPVLVSPTTSS